MIKLSTVIGINAHCWLSSVLVATGDVWKMQQNAKDRSIRVSSHKRFKPQYLFSNQNEGVSMFHVHVPFRA